MIDSHCHILPGVDDGAKSVTMALAMAKIALTAGTTGIICTPHNLNGSFFNDRVSVLDAVDALRQVFDEHGIALSLYPGSELHLTPELPSLLAVDQAMTYNNQGRSALVEPPKRSLPIGAESILGEILSLGITPVIAHPERNAVLAAEKDRAEEWVNFGCKLQLTAQSCSGEFGTPIQNACRHWCERGLVHLVASDGHRPTGRAPDMRRGWEALAEWCGETNARLLTMDNPRRLIDGEELVSMSVSTFDSSAQSRSKRWFSRFFS